jgi:hypothetical protein
MKFARTSDNLYVSEGETEFILMKREDYHCIVDSRCHLKIRRHIRHDWKDDWK